MCFILEKRASREIEHYGRRPNKRGWRSSGMVKASLTFSIIRLHRIIAHSHLTLA
jgi:hypothetical protein